MSAELREAVDATRGVQPWRRVVHAANGLTLALLLGPLGFPPAWIAGALAAALVLLYLADVVRLRNPRLNVLFFRAFRVLASPREERHVASSTWYAAGALAALLLFPLGAALLGILVLAVADPTASVVGRRWGRTPVGEGTVEGTAAFFAAGALAALAVAAPPAALAAAGAATLVEPVPWPLDDNLTIPVVAGAVAWGVGVA